MSKRFARAADQPDPESPELTAAEMARFRPLAKFPDLARRFRGPQKTPTKVQVTLRLDPDVVAHYRRQGRGWQTAVNRALRLTMAPRARRTRRAAVR
jgi:uncharacterized protein (DUF4415 family)